MRMLLRLPVLVFLLLALLVAGAFVARVTGLWPAGEPTRGRPQQRVP